MKYGNERDSISHVPVLKYCWFIIQNVKKCQTPIEYFQQICFLSAQKIIKGNKHAVCRLFIVFKKFEIIYNEKGRGGKGGVGCLLSCVYTGLVTKLASTASLWYMN